MNAAPASAAPRRRGGVRRRARGAGSADGFAFGFLRPGESFAEHVAAARRPPPRPRPARRVRRRHVPGRRRRRRDRRAGVDPPRAQRVPRARGRSHRLRRATGPPPAGLRHRDPAPEPRHRPRRTASTASSSRATTTTSGRRRVIEACGGVLERVVPASESRGRRRRSAATGSTDGRDARRAVVLFVAAAGERRASTRSGMRWDPVMCGAHRRPHHARPRRRRPRPGAPPRRRRRGGDGAVHGPPDRHRPLGTRRRTACTCTSTTRPAASPRCTRTWPSWRSRAGRGSRSGPTARSSTAARRRRRSPPGRGPSSTGFHAGWDVDVAAIDIIEMDEATGWRTRRAVRAARDALVAD